MSQDFLMYSTKNVMSVKSFQSILANCILLLTLVISPFLSATAPATTFKIVKENSPDGSKNKNDNNEILKPRLAKKDKTESKQQFDTQLSQTNTSYPIESELNITGIEIDTDSEKTVSVDELTELYTDQANKATFFSFDFTGERETSGSCFCRGPNGFAGPPYSFMTSKAACNSISATAGGGFGIWDCGGGDSDPPVVQSITVSSAANATSVVFTVTFDENANNISTDDFELTKTGTADGAIASVSAASGTIVTVTVNFVSGIGTLRLDLKASTDIDDDSDNAGPPAYTGGTPHSVSIPPGSATVATTVFLEGAYNGNGLNTAINGSIPSTQPYNGSTYNNHSGTESASAPASAVDWVLVELREAGSAAAALNSTKVGSAAGFLMSNGSIKATDGTSDLVISLTGNTGSDFYVVVYHRNHLPIMSANAITESGGTYTIDFTGNSANTYQTTTALVSLSGSKFGMPAGDLDQDGSINTTDLGTWRTNNGAAYSYSGSGIADFNLDGVINAVDRNDFYRKNTSKTRQVPST